jgi:hypothetical protein
MTMRDKMMDTHGINGAEPSTALKSKVPEWPSPGSSQPNVLLSEMYLPALVTQCLREIDYDRRGKPCTESARLELFRRAIVQNDPKARLWLQYCFSGLVRGWLHRHPQREAACCLQSEETSVALAFERFWQVSTQGQRVEFRTVAAALQYLRASLHGALLDTVRASGRPKAILVPEAGQAGEPGAEDGGEHQDLWEVIRSLVPDQREQRLTYLLFHCGLGPREIVRFCPQEFCCVEDIYRLRRTIVERLVRHANT